MTAQTKQQGKVIRVGVVGCGAITERAHIPVLTKLSDRFRVSALVDRSEERTSELAALAGSDPKRMTSHEGLADVAEIALVATPPHSHVPVVGALLRHGVHVLCEKPLGRTVAECQEMIDAAETGNSTLTIGVNRRYFRSWRLIHNLKRTGILGQLVSVTFEEGAPFNWPIVTYSNFDPELSGGGVLLDTGAHSVDMAVWLAGERPDVIHYEDDNRQGVEANCMLIMSFGQTLFTIRLSRTHNLMNKLVAVFEKGTISAECWESSPYGLQIWDPEAEKAVRSMYADIARELPADPFEAEWIALHDRVATASPADSTARDAMTGVDLIKYCYAHRETMQQPWMDVHAPERSKVG